MSPLLALLPRALSLTLLRMESCSLVSKYGFVLIGQSCRLLEELDLTYTELDNEGLKAISACYKLSSLKIGIYLNINDKGLIHVGNSCREIHELDLYRLRWMLSNSGNSSLKRDYLYKNLKCNMLTQPSARMIYYSIYIQC